MPPLTPTEIGGFVVLALVVVVVAVLVDRSRGHAAAGGSVVGLIAVVGVVAYLRVADEAAALALATALGQQALARFGGSADRTVSTDDDDDDDEQLDDDDSDEAVVDRRPPPTLTLDRSDYPHAPKDPDS